MSLYGLLVALLGILFRQLQMFRMNPPEEAIYELNPNSGNTAAQYFNIRTDLAKLPIVGSKVGSTIEQVLDFRLDDYPVPYFEIHLSTPP